MLVKRDSPLEGTCFAWRPVRTDEGWVWLERVYYNTNPSWGWGSAAQFVYQRIRSINEASRDAAYRTPPEGFCDNVCDDGPTPCHFPFCRAYNDDGTSRCVRHDQRENTR